MHNSQNNFHQLVMLEIDAYKCVTNVNRSNDFQMEAQFKRTDSALIRS